MQRDLIVRSQNKRNIGLPCSGNPCRNQPASLAPKGKITRSPQHSVESSVGHASCILQVNSISVCDSVGMGFTHPHGLSGTEGQRRHLQDCRCQGFQKKGEI